ncbi:MAG: uL30 family ribosomal protein [Candidatus Woesearchaeota archaeon]
MKKETKKETTKNQAKNNLLEKSELLGVVLIGRTANARFVVKDTLKKLNLLRHNSLAIIPKTPSYLGMIKKVEPFITWGEINQETIKLLKEKRTPIVKKNSLIFRLNPPRKGFERKGIKKPFNLGGAYGYRAEKINDLIRRMI